MYEYLRSLLVSKAEAGDHVVVILDALDQFVREKSNTKQLLLYNLLDWLQVRRHDVVLSFMLERII